MRSKIDNEIFGCFKKLIKCAGRFECAYNAWQLARNSFHVSVPQTRELARSICHDWKHAHDDFPREMKDLHDHGWPEEAFERDDARAHA